MKLVVALLLASTTASADVTFERVFATSATTWKLHYGLAWSSGEGLHLLLHDKPIDCGTQAEDVHGVVIGIAANGDADIMLPGGDGGTVPATKVTLVRADQAGRATGTLKFDYTAPHDLHVRARGSFDVKLCKAKP